MRHRLPERDQLVSHKTGGNQQQGDRAGDHDDGRQLALDGNVLKSGHNCPAMMQNDGTSPPHIVPPDMKRFSFRAKVLMIVRRQT
jgi:hypothetical protein